MRVLAVEKRINEALKVEKGQRWPARIAVRYRHGLDIEVEGLGAPVFISTVARGLFPSHMVVTEDVLEKLLAKPSGAALILCSAPEAAHHGEPTLIMPTREFDLQLRMDINEVADNLLLSRRTQRFMSMLGMVAQTGGLAPFDVLFSEHWAGRDAFDVNAGTAAAMQALIGCGRGSTPAGDDMLVGAASVCHVLSGVNGETGRRARQWLNWLGECQPTFAERTTRMSCGYLNAALDGVFGSHLITLHRTFWNITHASLLTSMLRVKKHGATSGVDVLAGVCLGYRYLQA